MNWSQKKANEIQLTFACTVSQKPPNKKEATLTLGQLLFHRVGVSLSMTKAANKLDT